MTTRNHRSRAPLALALLALVAFVATSCIEGDDPIIVEPDAGPLFERYVSLGNSITAGFQSGGIVDSTQQEAFPVLLAAKAGARFGVPSLAAPGCPPLMPAPFVSVPSSCAARTYARPDPIQNVAVPGATTAEASSVSPSRLEENPLFTMILGGRTQLSAMADADPSLISVWIGNNDALGAALSGDTTALTPTATFQSEYDEIVTAMNGTDAQDAILIGVANPMLAAPALQPGAYFWALGQQQPSQLPPLDVSDNCSPFDPAGGGGRLVSLAAVASQITAGADTIRIDCSEQAPGLLNQAEQDAITARIVAFNSYIEQQAVDNSWIYIDPMAILGPALMDTDNIRKCQGLATATDSASFAAAVENTCPGPTAPNFFGAYFSFDAVHPSGLAHGVIADTLAGRLNEAHGLSLPIN